MAHKRNEQGLYDVPGTGWVGANGVKSPHKVGAKLRMIRQGKAPKNPPTDLEGTGFARTEAMEGALGTRAMLPSEPARRNAHATAAVIAILKSAEVIGLTAAELEAILTHVVAIKKMDEPTPTE